ncbi:protein kinase domain-containing protein [Coleofasciculus sp. E1-EBD-02]|uniref:protein kinase domain-containing protein n=1 Tax=Coleofasciculus sp. E1-EBD-02 TaxID=3068481 RepID=UPI0032F96805
MIGALLDQRYQVVQVLGQGGFGHTYLAQDTHRPGNPTCVVKHLKPATSEPDFLQTARRLFNGEAETLEKLGTHDQIPRLLAYFEDNQEFYLVQDFIAGHPLSVELQPGQRWQEDQVIQLLHEVLSILEFVHSNHVIHRDIKPDNLIRRTIDNQLVLVDFGAVKQVKMPSIMAQAAVSDTVGIGTPGYMPSEQGQGRPRPNSDIYALGMIAIQALTGLSPTQLVEDPETGEIIWQQYAQVSQGLAIIMTKMVRHYFKYRYQSATEALQALQALTHPHTPQNWAVLVNHKGRFYLTETFRFLGKLTKPAANVSNNANPANPSPSSTIPAPQSANSDQNTVTVAPVNRSRSPVGSSSHPNPITHSPRTLSILIGVGAFTLGAIAISGINRLSTSPTTPPNNVELAQNQLQSEPTTHPPESESPSHSPQPEPTTHSPQPEPAQSCVIVTTPTNLRSLSGRQKTGTVLQKDTQLTVTGKEENGWIEISEPDPGWIWKRRTKNTCPSN